MVFVHGLDGDGRGTWSRKDAESFWPEWLATDLAEVAVFTVGYDAWSSGWRGRSMPMQDRAVNLMAQLQNHGIGQRPLCFVTHSMGGLLVKEILLHAAECRTEFAAFAEAAKGVVFLATPHTGAGLAKAVKALGVLYRGSPAVDDLERNKPYLRHLNDRYRNWVDDVKIGNLVFFETRATKGLRVVDEMSANPGLARVTPIGVDANHVDICKPVDPQSLVYGQVKRFVSSLCDTLGHPGPAKADTDATSVAGWRQSPGFSPAIRSLMHAQVQAALELPYRLPGARRPSLATVYVRQDLGSGVEEPQSEQPRPTPILDDRGRIVDLPDAPKVRVAVRPPARTVRDALDSDRHLVVAGGPGQGKSTLSLRLAADIANRWHGPADADVPLTEPVVPLRLTARELATRLELPFAQALAESARVEYGALLRVPLDASTLSDRVDGCPWLVLVDGLDEVANAAERDRLVSVLSAWASESPDSPYRVVVTTRPIEGAALAPLQRIGAARYELQPFDEDALRHFAESWFGDVGVSTADRFLREVREAHLDELVKVPLLATIAAIVFEQYGDRPLPDNQYELYEAYLSYLAPARADVSELFGHHRTPLLEHLGRVRLESDASLVAAAHDWVLVNIPSRELVMGWQDVLTTFLASTGPLVIRSDDLSFLHHSFAEHLAATAIARGLPERFSPDDDGFATYLHTGQVKESGRHARAVLLHYTRLRPNEADRVMRWMHVGTPDQHLLAARLLARHIPASTGAVDEFLETVRGWAMTSQDTGKEILRQACRAAHHPGLDRWLFDLMRNTDTPWYSRIETATALVTRLRSTHTVAAATLLRTVVDDIEVPVGHRLKAAEALADSRADECGSAERGLRAVLDDPLASGAHCRTAAVVLSALGPRARANAVEALSRLVSDPATPTVDLVEAATGLVEIDIEFHEGCAEVFLGVLNDQVDSIRGRRDAALGLSSLGPQHQAEAVTALVALITNHRFAHTQRAVMARALGELGPQHRLAAGEQIIDMLATPGVSPLERAHCATHLAELGTEFKEHAIYQLRSVLRDPDANEYDVLSAARYLAGIGPEYRTESMVTMWKTQSNPLAGAVTRFEALADIVRVGDLENRQQAVDLLRAVLADCAADPMKRCKAAEHLVDAGPEFHTEAAVHLQALATSHYDPEVAAHAWTELLKLGSAYREQAFANLLEFLRSTDFGRGLPYSAIVAFASSNAEQTELAASALVLALTDKTRTLRTRITASNCLLILGRNFHQCAVAGMRDLLRATESADMDFPFAVQAFTNAGTGPRAELAELLRDVILDPPSPSTRKWQAVKGLGLLGFTLDPNLVPMLCAIVADPSVKLKTRHEAAVVLARTSPEHLPAATEAILRVDDKLAFQDWVSAVVELIHLGANVEPRLRAILEDHDTILETRRAAATMLIALDSDSTETAHAELLTQAEDQTLGSYQRSESWQGLDRSHRTDLPRRSLTYHQEVFEDEHESVTNRIIAAGHLARLDTARTDQTLAFLYRITEDQGTPTDDRRYSAEWIDHLKSRMFNAADPQLPALLRDPRTRPSDRQRLITRLPRQHRTEAERDLLMNRSIPINDRMPKRDIWDDLPLQTEAEEEARAALTAIESPPAERVAAAATLATLSWRLIPESVRLLKQFAHDGFAAHRARRELSGLGQEARRYVLTWAEDQVRGETAPRRARYRAARLAMDLTTDPPPVVSSYLRQRIQDEHTSDQDKVEALFALRRVAGLNALRAVRDDERRSPVTRWQAAAKLLNRSTEDRTTAIRLFHEIAADTTLRPALRWRVAESLSQLGRAGRDRAAIVLRSMTLDTTLPTTSRAQAARVLSDTMPSARRDMLKMLRGMAAETPLHRRQVLLAAGAVDTSAATTELIATADKDGISALARLRCAEALIHLRSDHRETAAKVARSVAHDTSVATHIRRHAACDLARWSDLCRAEAQELIRTLTTASEISRTCHESIPYLGDFTPDVGHGVMRRGSA
ncbi:NACHT domain-containing protein [Actinophytocola sediminis]